MYLIRKGNLKFSKTINEVTRSSLAEAMGVSRINIIFLTISCSEENKSWGSCFRRIQQHNGTLDQTYSLQSQLKGDMEEEVEKAES